MGTQHNKNQDETQYMVESKVTCTAPRPLFKSKPVFDSELGHELSYVVKISP